LQNDVQNTFCEIKSCADTLCEINHVQANILCEIDLVQAPGKLREWSGGGAPFDAQAYLPQSQLVLESQLLPKIVNLLFII